MRKPSCLLFRICKKAKVASFEIAEDAEGLMRFHADRISVSGTSREEYRESRDSTIRYVSNGHFQAAM